VLDLTKLPYCCYCSLDQKKQWLSSKE